MTQWPEYNMRRWSDEDISSAQTEHATALRIPFLRTRSPRFNFVTGIVVDDWVRRPYLLPDRGAAPTNDEVTQVAEWRDLYNRYYNQGFREAMARWPFDVDGGANLGYLLKRDSGLWSYRKRTWRSLGWGPRTGPLPLDELLPTIFSGWGSLVAGGGA